MSEGNVVARISQLKQAATDIGTSARKIDDAVDVTDQQVTSLGPDKFASPAADTFRQRYTSLTSTLISAYQELMAFKTKLEDSAEAIDRATRT